jgi:hypothetical protein
MNANPSKITNRFSLNGRFRFNASTFQRFNERSAPYIFLAQAHNKGYQ